MKNREIVEAVTSELERVGASDIEYRHEGRGHPRVWYTLGGKRLWYVVPGTTSDTLRAAKNSRSDIRRMHGRPLRKDAASTPRRARKAAVRRPRAQCPPITVMPDPWQPLGALKERMPEAPESRPSLLRRVLAWLR